jgi:hypothetical protein
MSKYGWGSDQKGVYELDVKSDKHYVSPRKALKLLAKELTVVEMVINKKLGEEK